MKDHFFDTLDTSIDSLLDKISNKGMDSLYEFERIKLDNIDNPMFNYQEFLIENINKKVDNELNIEKLIKEISIITSLSLYDRSEISKLYKDYCEIIVYRDCLFINDSEQQFERYYAPYTDLSQSILEDINRLLEEL